MRPSAKHYDCREICFMIVRNFPSFAVLLFVLLAFSAKPFLNYSAAADRPDDAPESALYSEDWRATGPPGGDVRALVVDPKDPLHFYFGTLDGQIYTSTDGARTWHLLYNFNIPRLFVDHILIDPRDSNTIYVGAHRHKEAGGVFKTTYGGHKKRGSKKLKKE